MAYPGGRSKFCAKADEQKGTMLTILALMTAPYLPAMKQHALHSCRRYVKVGKQSATYGLVRCHNYHSLEGFKDSRAVIAPLNRLK